MSTEAADGIAIIGMAGRFPKAPDLDSFWANLREGLETVSFFSDDELEANGVRRDILEQQNYVKAKAVLDDAELFDAELFEFSPREAQLTDPQIRVFLECAHQAFENAGYNPDLFPGLISGYTGMALSTYMLQNLVPGQATGRIDSFRALLGSDKDYLSTWVSYKLNLHGPSVNVQTACSTGLVAVHLACRALMTFECDMALAGAVSISFPQRVGYLYEEGSIFSSDGHCRPFDAKSTGSVAGEGVGAVILKRLDEALSSGDFIHAVIRGSAINNDGRRKVGFTAPSVEGQAQVISMAHAVADIPPESIDYVEAHGSGTTVGDPIEVTALNQAFAGAACISGIALGSVKGNLGHLGPAAGIAALLKTVLAIEHSEIPPSLHFGNANPKIPFSKGPFRVNQNLCPWPSANTPRRAGVSSFGLGGTNAHLVLEQAPATEPSNAAAPWQLLVLSATNDAALSAAKLRLTTVLKQNSDLNLADTAFTLQMGRRPFAHRCAVVCRDTKDAIEVLDVQGSPRVMVSKAPQLQRPLTFLLPGLGDHYCDMGRGIYDTEPTFRRLVEECCEAVTPHLGLDLLPILYPLQRKRNQDNVDSSQRLDFRKLLQQRGEGESWTEQQIFRTICAQPALFILEYSLAKLWMSWGIVPNALLGYSVGEYVAACLAGVISVEDSLRLVAARARAIESLPPGAMLAVGAAESEVRPLLPPDSFISSVHSNSMTMAAGSVEGIEHLESELVRKGMTSRRVRSSHAFHTPHMRAISEALEPILRAIRMRPPQIPYISNVSGTWISDSQATDPTYWISHLCQPTQLALGIQEICSGRSSLFLEVGPGQMMSAHVAQSLASAGSSSRVIFTSLPSASEQKADRQTLLQALGELWLSGVEPKWASVHEPSRRRRIPLPTYPFQRQSYSLVNSSRQKANSFSPFPGVLSPERTYARPEPAITGDPIGVLGNEDAYDRPDLQSEFAAPTKELEQRITEIWERLLGIRPIGIHDLFVRLGGNSLLAIQVASELRSAFQIELPLQAVLAASTISELALVVEEALIMSVEAMDEADVT